jgi:biotin synthase
MSDIKHNWTEKELLEIYNMPLLELVYKAATIHRKYHHPQEVQISSLVSIKTGGCSEDCGYCPQSIKYNTGVDAHGMLPVDDVVQRAKEAKEKGVSRMCLGAAWREVRDNRDFDKVLEMVKSINDMDMEVCCTLGMINEEQAKKLADAGLYAYNHNVDTSEENYGNVITTRTYKDRLQTLENVRKSKITICSGGIIGMGEKTEDRIGMLLTLSRLNPHPESVPINTLVAVEGTPMEDQEQVPIWDLVRMIATARIAMPKSAVRLSAGRLDRTMEGQALCFMAGANSIFAGDKLLTTPNPEFDEDMQLFKTLGLIPKKSFVDAPKPTSTIDLEKIKEERQNKNAGVSTRQVKHVDQL